MSTKVEEGRVRQLTPTPTTRIVSTLGRVDYEDAFAVDVGPTHTRSAEQWVREILEGAPSNVRLKLLSGWSAIGIKLRLPGSDRTVLGWDIRSSDPDCALLGADSRVGMPGELLLRREDNRLLFATFVRYDNPIARALWASIEAAHVRTVRSILELASRRAS
jgi:hypothetical protein